MDLLTTMPAILDFGDPRAPYRASCSDPELATTCRRHCRNRAPVRPNVRGHRPSGYGQAFHDDDALIRALRWIELEGNLQRIRVGDVFLEWLNDIECDTLAVDFRAVLDDIHDDDVVRGHGVVGLADFHLQCAEAMGQSEFELDAAATARAQRSRQTKNVAGVGDVVPLLLPFADGRKDVRQAQRSTTGAGWDDLGPIGGIPRSRLTGQVG